MDSDDYFFLYSFIVCLTATVAMLVLSEKNRNNDDLFFAKFVFAIFSIAALTQVLPRKVDDSEQMFGKPIYRLSDGQN